MNLDHSPGLIFVGHQTIRHITRDRLCACIRVPGELLGVDAARNHRQSGKKKQYDRAHELPLKDTDINSLTDYQSNANRDDFKEFVGRFKGRN